MPKINLLESSVYNRIAAGEVVQQPSSVVKELLENSIDAGATNITIAIKDGGIKEISIKDNGCGIDREDLKKAFLPHATSKVKTIEDLDSVSTLGFRGEALASIASVSHITAHSKTQDSELGFKVDIRGGDFSEIEIEPCTLGTTITVKNLFFNTPARAKFLRKPYQEEADITMVIQKTAFSNPFIAFTYIIDGKLMYKTNGDGLLSTINAIYGVDFADASIPVDYKKGNISIKGFICKPTFTKPNRNYQTIIVNGRYIKDFAFSASIANAFGERLMKRCFPIFILDVIIPFEDVDVNVHPAKTEVRFKRPSEVYGVAFNAIKNALNSIDSASGLGISNIEQSNNFESINIENTKDKRNEVISDSQKSDKYSLFDSFIKQESNYNNDSISSSTSINQKLIDKLLNYDSNEQYDNTNRTEEIQSQKTQIKQATFNLENSYKILGQIFDCYILVQTNDCLLIIDQHAAHERLIYDELTVKTDYSKNISQQLLLPYVRTFSPKEYERISDITEELINLGFEIEEFGRQTIKVSAVPMILSEIKLDEFFNGFLSDYDNKSDFTYSDLLKDKLAIRACRSAIKAGDALSETQIFSILNQVIETNMTLQCPHGRPIAIKYTKKDLEKLFKRIV